MGKTLVIAEKPSVGRDLAAALPGAFAKNEAYLESDDYVVTWAVGHLVELAQPEDYDEKLKKWRMADLPIVPEDFRLKPRDAKSKKQLTAIRKLLERDDIDRVVNACDAGREGELIFAYIYESTGAKKPVDRLWISSMTKQAIREGFERLRPGEQLRPLEQAARSRSEADWLVGMNATRAATIRGRAWVGGVVSLGRVQTPTLAMIVKREREIQAFTPEPYWLVHATFDPRYHGLWFEGDETRLKDGKRADGIVEKVTGKTGRVESVERKEQSERARGGRGFFRPGPPPLSGCLPPAGPVCPHDDRHRSRGRALSDPRQGDARGRLARRLRPRARRGAEAGRGRRGRGGTARAPAGAGGPLCRRRKRGEGDEAAAPLHGGDAALWDGDRRQARRRRGAARGDEGARPRDAGDPCRDHRDADPP